mmetsp:Transcript_25113/g.74583  ORF Transcript_25113/g.74583 Transcript_25113/m.74583 type:complete len:296 (+) Transcript_25113:1505-2392(+)
MKVVQVADLVPVRHQQPFEAQPLAQQPLQQRRRANHGLAVHLLVALHRALYAGVHRGLEGRQVGLLQLAPRQPRALAVVPVPRRRVAHKVLHARRRTRRDLALAAAPLHPLHHRRAHPRDQQRVLAKRLVHARPERVRRDAEDGGKHPRRRRGAAVLAGDPAGGGGERLVEGRGEAELLRQQGCAAAVRRAVDRVDAVDERRQTLVGGGRLDVLDSGAPLRGVPARRPASRIGAGEGRVEQRPQPVDAKLPAQLRVVDAQRAAVCEHHGDIQLRHLADLIGGAHACEPERSGGHS